MPVTTMQAAALVTCNSRGLLNKPIEIWGNIYIHLQPDAIFMRLLQSLCQVAIYMAGVTTNACTAHDNMVGMHC